MFLKRILYVICAVLLVFSSAFTVAADETTVATTTTTEGVIITPFPPTVAETTTTTTETTTTTTTTVPTTEATTVPEVDPPTEGDENAPVIPEWGEETEMTTETTEVTTTETTTTTTTIPTTVTIPTQTGEVLFPEYEDRVVVVSEPSQSDDKVYFYQGNRKVKSTDFNWVPGHNGYAVLLDGDEQYLRCSSQLIDGLSSFTFSAWINWQGGVPNQKLLTIYKNDNRFFSVSPNWDDESQEILGWYLEVRDRGIEPTVAYYPVRGGYTYALQPNSWHHVAVTVSDATFALYVDGREYLSANYELSLADMELNTFLVGGGFYGDARLAAMIDDAYLYPTALSAENIALLAADMNPVFGGSAPTTTVYYPTAPTTTATLKPADGNVPSRGTVLGLPLALVLIPLGVVVVAVALSFALNAQKKKQPDWYDEDEGEASPTLNDPEQPTDNEEEQE